MAARAIDPVQFPSERAGPAAGGLSSAGGQGRGPATSHRPRAHRLEPAGRRVRDPEETIVVAEIPGVDPTKVELSITGNLLILRGVKEAGELPEPQLQVRERRFGTFLRQIMVSTDVDFDAAQADASNGVLTIRLPKRNAAKPRTIPIRPS